LAQGTGQDLLMLLTSPAPLFWNTDVADYTKGRRTITRHVTFHLKIEYCGAIIPFEFTFSYVIATPPI
jgi:hypothetical protein